MHQLKNNLYLKREDLVGKGISGNKYRKLKYNILEAKRLGYTKILTFGGAYSNHILAASYIKKLHGIEVIGVIRGEELREKVYQNPTLLQAQQNGMQFYFVPRELYREKNSKLFLAHLKEIYGDFYFLPEGGTNPLAVKGCEEILTEEDKKFNYVCCPVGTGGTVAGLINSSKSKQNVIGFSALKGDFLAKEVATLVTKTNWSINNDYHFGGYAKVTKELIDFLNEFKATTGVTLDAIYNGKMMFGIYDLLKKEFFPKNTSILAIHTGGLQSIDGMNQLLQKKGLPLINK